MFKVIQIFRLECFNKFSENTVEIRLKLIILVSCQASNDATLSYGRMQVSKDFPSSDRTWKRQKRLDMTVVIF